MTAEYSYDEFCNALKCKDSDGHSEEYTYDEFGNVLSYKDSNHDD